MGLLKLRKNKRYNYTPRHYKGEGSPYELKHKFDEFRTTVGPQNGMKGKFNNAIDDYKNPDKSINKRVLIIVGVLILLFLFLIDFDLSIFFDKS